MISANPFGSGLPEAVFCCLVATGEGKLPGRDQKAKPVKSLAEASHEANPD